MSFISKIFKFFIEDFTAKIVCTFLAVLIWVYVSDQYTTTYTDVKFELQFETDAAIAVRSDVSRVFATIKGPQGKLQQVISQSPTVRYPLPVTPQELKGTTIRRDIKLSAENFSLPDGVSVSAIRPIDFSVTLGTEPSRYLPVTPQIVNGAKARYPYHITISPSEVRIFGPWEIISKLKTVNTEPIDLTDRESAFSRHLKIQETISSNKIRCNENINVDIRFNKDLVRTTLKSLPISLITPPGFAFDVEPIKQQIDITVEHEKVLKEGVLVRPVIDLSAVKAAGEQAFPIQLMNPQNVKIVNQSASSLRLQIKEKK